MTDVSRVHLTVRTDGTVLASNERGASVAMASDSMGTFTPVELLAAALGGCAGLDFSSLMSKQRRSVTPLDIEVVAEEGIDGDERVTSARVVYHLLREALDAAKVERARRITAEDQCTVSRTLERGCPVEHVVGEAMADAGEADLGS